MTTAKLFVAWTWRRLGKRWAVASLALASVGCALGVGVERLVNPSYAADHALLGVTFGLSVPLLAWLTVGRVFPTSLEQSLESLAECGADRRQAACWAAGALALWLAGAGSWLGLITALLGNYRTDELWFDLGTCAWVGALGAASYGLLHAFSTLWGRQGRVVALVLDWVLGAGAGFVAAFWPRSHLRNLLGGTDVLALTQWQSAIALSALALVCLLGLRGRLAR